MSTRAVPVLASSDVTTSLAFYRGLGFENRGAAADEWDYLILVRDEIEIHVTGPTIGERPQGFCFVYVDDADELYGEWRDHIAAPGRIERPFNTNYGMRVFVVVDPDGNELRVGSAAKPELR